MPEPKEQRIATLFDTAKECEGEIAFVNGSIPNWLKGTFLRTGPGKYDLDSGFTVNHVLDGYAMLTKFEIDGDKVKLQTKFFESDAYKRATAAGKPMICEFGTRAYPDPSKSFFSRMIPTIIPELTDNPFINLFNIGQHTFTCGEVCHFHELNTTTLGPVGKYDAQKLFGCQLLCPHPIQDEDGTIYNIGISFLTGLKYNVIKVPPQSPKATSKDLLKKAKILATISSPNTTTLSYLHSFGLSKNYIILIEQPYILCVSKVLSAALHKSDSQKDWMEYRPEMKNRFTLIEKATGKVIKTEYFSSESFFFLHVINCYEENEQIVMDLVTFNNIDFLESMMLEKVRAGKNEVPEDSRPRGTRFVIPTTNLKTAPEGVDLVGVKSTAKAVKSSGGQIILTPEICTEPGCELPTLNKNYVTKKFNYYYATGAVGTGYFENALGKVDIRNKETMIYREDEDSYFGEPLFVPRPGGTAEDDGVIITAVNNISPSQNDYLLFLDAKNMQELGRVKFQSRIPQALHGLFLFSQ